MKYLSEKILSGTVFRKKDVAWDEHSFKGEPKAGNVTN